MRQTGHREAVPANLLTGDRAAGILTTALEVADGELLSWRPRLVMPRPGRGATVVYRVRARWPGGRTGQHTMVACTGDVPQGALVLDDGTDRVGVWRVPLDPGLPGLAAALDETCVANLLERLRQGGGRVRLRLRAYRPQQRAVVEVTCGRARLFLKVVNPDRVERLHNRHRLLVRAGIPAPPSLGWSPDGILVLQALPGRTLRRTMHSRSAPIPTGADVLALLDRLPAELAEGRPQRSWLEKAPYYASIIGTALPDEAERATDLGGELAAEAASAEVESADVVPTHGDLYENQLLVRNGQICGLLDVDTAGPGDRLDDLACLLGHLAVLAQVDRRRASLVRRTADAYLSAFEARVPPAALRLRVAAVVLSLATGPHRAQERGWPASTRRRLELAETWLARASPEA